MGKWNFMRLICNIAAAIIFCLPVLAVAGPKISVCDKNMALLENLSTDTKWIDSLLIVQKTTTKECWEGTNWILWVTRVPNTFVVQWKNIGPLFEKMQKDTKLKGELLDSIQIQTSAESLEKLSALAKNSCPRKSFRNLCKELAKKSSTTLAEAKEYGNSIPD